MNSVRMTAFIDKFINNKFKKCLVIMDNGGSHKNKLIKTKIEETGNKLLYSVPYKPKTNSIESWFSQFKHYFVIDNPSISFQELEKFVIKQ
jgi:transposase|tara:strand:- start:2852 stop:3124 length:273 start_codon:yes stop_codon:yes gene_type:complete